MNAKKIWNNRKDIYEGIKNNVLKKDDVEEIARRRLEICEKCDLYDKNGKKCEIKGTGPCCGQCGCSLKFMVRSLSHSCPHPDGPKWKALLSEEEEQEFIDKCNSEEDADN